MEENNQELNQENAEEIFEMEELTETEEKDLTGGASVGKGGNSTFRINLPIPAKSINYVKVGECVLRTPRKRIGTVAFASEGGSTIKIYINTRNQVGGFTKDQLAKLNNKVEISYVAIDGITRNITSRIKPL